MGRVDEESYCSICGECRSSRTRRAEHDRGFIEQICSRRKCSQVKRQLRKASRTTGSAGSLVIEIHHYHHTSHLNEADFSRTHVYSSELHAQSLPQNRAVLPARGGTPYVEPLTKLSENIVRQCLDDNAR